MIKIQSFTFNPFSENTYILYDESGQCIIIDPGCSNTSEEKKLSTFIEKEQLIPVRLINTHSHIDHVLGNYYIYNKYKLDLEIHPYELEVLKSGVMTASMYNITYKESPLPGKYINEYDRVTFGNSILKVLFTPGHSPGSISFYSMENNFVISGDVLFNGSVGRTDLPGGNIGTLTNSIITKLYTLPDITVVYSGHGNPTNIGHEKKHNPFVRA